MRASSSPDVNWWTVDYCDVFIRLSFWRHPFTAEHPLLRHRCSATFLQIFVSWRNKLFPSFFSVGNAVVFLNSSHISEFVSGWWRWPVMKPSLELVWRDELSWLCPVADIEGSVSQGCVSNEGHRVSTQHAVWHTQRGLNRSSACLCQVQVSVVRFTAVWVGENQIEVQFVFCTLPSFMLSV